MITPSPEALAEQLERILNERGRAAIVEPGESVGTVARRIQHHNENLIQCITANWPIILAALSSSISNNGPEDRKITPKCPICGERNGCYGNREPTQCPKHKCATDSGVVIQADRDAAQNVLIYRTGYTGTACKDGEMDDHWLVQAFRDHRLAFSRPEPVGDEALVERVKYDKDAQSAVMSLLERGKATVDSDGYLTLAAIQAIPAPATDAGQSADGLVERKDQLLIDLLRREGHHSGVWFRHRLLEAADRLAALSSGNEVTKAEPKGTISTELSNRVTNIRKKGLGIHLACDLWNLIDIHFDEIMDALQAKEL